jgi:hypothetical protein
MVPRDSIDQSTKTVRRKSMKSYGYLLALFCAVAPIMSPAQDVQRFEAFGGYSFSHNNTLLDPTNNFSGWDTSSTVFLNRWFGLTADLSGHYGSQSTPLIFLQGEPYGKVKVSASSYTYLFGPHFTYRRSRYAPFAETLFGINNPHHMYTLLESPGCQGCSSGPVGSSSGGSYHSFAMAMGGGLDIALSHGISLRPVEVDYLLLREPTPTVDNGVLSTTARTTIRSDFQPA